MRHFLFCLVFIAACSKPEYIDIIDTRTSVNHVLYAFEYLGYNERKNRRELKELTGVDPVNTEWCAAFVNAVLHNNDYLGSDSFSDYPLMARSFVSYGEQIETPEIGDIIVFPRGSTGWQGHVGFYLRTDIINNKKYYLILSGNDYNEVRINHYSARSAVAIVRPISANPLKHQEKSWLVRTQDDQQSLQLVLYDRLQHILPDWLL